MNSENPYRSLVDTKETFLRQQPVTNHSNANQDKSRLWIALAVSPVVGPLLCTFIVTVAGFYYQSTSNDVEVSPMGLIFFPVVALILGLPANYVLMGITLTPIMLWLKKRQRPTFLATLIVWLGEVAALVIVYLMFHWAIAPDELSINNLYSIAFAMIIVGLPSLVSFWIMGIRGRPKLSDCEIPTDSNNVHAEHFANDTSGGSSS